MPRRSAVPAGARWPGCRPPARRTSTRPTRRVRVPPRDSWSRPTSRAWAAGALVECGSRPRARGWPSRSCCGPRSLSAPGDGSRCSPVSRPWTPSAGSAYLRPLPGPTTSWSTATRGTGAPVRASSAGCSPRGSATPSSSASGSTSTSTATSCPCREPRRPISRVSSYVVRSSSSPCSTTCASAISPGSSLEVTSSEPG